MGLGEAIKVAGSGSMVKFSASHAALWIALALPPILKREYFGQMTCILLSVPNSYAIDLPYTLIHVRIYRNTSTDSSQRRMEYICNIKVCYITRIFNFM